MVHITRNGNNQGLIQNPNIEDEFFFKKRPNGFQQKAPFQMFEKVLNMPLTKKLKILKLLKLFKTDFY